MADVSTPVSTAIAREAASVIQWHPSYCSALKFELRNYKKELCFREEFPVTRGSLFADLIVIECEQPVKIENQIGKIFHKYNLFEFKSPEDDMTIDDFYKVTAYASFFKCSGNYVNAYPAEEITLTMMRASKPKKMFRMLTAAGVIIKEKYPGIYYLSNKARPYSPVQFRTQIVVTEKLDSSKHSSFRVLTNDAKEDDIRRFLDEALKETEQGDRNNVDSILQVSVSANKKIYEQIRRDKGMCQALRELMKEDIQKEIDEARVETRDKTRAEDRVKEIKKVVNIYQTEMNLDDQTIIDKIAAQYELSEDEAKAYVVPEASDPA